MEKDQLDSFLVDEIWNDYDYGRCGPSFYNVGEDFNDDTTLANDFIEI